MSYKYKIFGFNVFSDIKLDVYCHDYYEEPDINIAYGDVSFPELNYNKTGFIFNESIIKMQIKDVSAYEIINGNSIIIAPHVGAKESEIQLFLLGSAFGFLMHQRSEFPLHGSAIDIDGKCIVVVGQSGSGKSSLACGFINRGFKLLSDDVSRICFSEGIYHVHPSYPSQKVWLDVIEKFSIQYNPQNQIVNRFDKYYINTLERFCDAARPLYAIIELMPNEVDQISIIELTGKDKLNALIMHSYRQEMMGPYMDLNAHLKWCIDLGRKTAVYRITRPNLGFTIDEQVKLILKILSI